MSRSVKKTPVCKNRNRRKTLEKRQAGKRVRRRRNLSNGGAFRKVSDPCIIADDVERMTRTEWEELRNRTGSKYYSEKNWEKLFLRK